MEVLALQDLDFGLLNTSAILSLEIAWTTPSDDEIFYKTIGEVLMIEACQGN